MIYSSEIHSKSAFQAIIEDNGLTLWLYITDSFGTTIRDSWLLNKQDPIEAEVRDFTTPVPEEFLTEDHPQTFSPEDFSFEWENNGEAIHILYKKESMAWLGFEVGRGYNRFLNKVCPWGLPLSELPNIK